MGTNLPTSRQLYRYYNDEAAYGWTKKAMGGGWEPLDFARLLAVRSVIEKLNISGDKLLDVGCGNGMFCELASKYFRRVTGMDISKRAVGQLQAKNRIRNVRYIHGRAEKLAFKNRSLDMVFCFETLEHLKSPQDALKEIFRVLKPTGSAMISVPNWFAWDRLGAYASTGPLLFKLKKWLNPRNDFVSHLHFHSPGEWEKIFGECGLRSIFSRPVYIFPFIPDLMGIKNFERRWFSVPHMIERQQRIESRLTQFWPLADLGQSHLWVLGKSVDGSRFMR